MIFAPVRLGETSLNAEAVAADKKSCKRFGPCGVGKEALFLNSYFIDRRYYVAFSSVRRVFKRVAMSQGGFSGQGVFGAIPYLVVQYDGGKEKQCTFKREEDVDAMLAYIGEVHPEIPTLSVGGEQRLEQKAKEEAARYLSELTSDAQSAKEELEKAQKFLSGYPELTDRLSKAARAKRVNQHTNPAYRWVALAIVLAGALTFVPVVLVGLFALRVLKVDFGSVSGLLCGSMANPMALNYVNDTIEGDNPSVSYATVYPVCMFLRVIIIQVMLMLVL